MAEKSSILTWNLNQGGGGRESGMPYIHNNKGSRTMNWIQEKPLTQRLTLHSSIIKSS
jgi:hypothetical protein